MEPTMSDQTEHYETATGPGREAAGSSVAPPGADPVACSLDGVSVSYEGDSILSNVTLSFPSRRCTVVMGFSGSGKSTLLKAAAGLVVPDHGSVSILGTDLVRSSDREIERLRSRTGFVFQDGALWQNMTLRANIELPLRYHRPEMDREQIDRTVAARIAELDAGQRLDLRPAQVSAGEQKVVSFIRALIVDPELVFLDEPTTSVDGERSDLMLRALRTLKERGRTIIAVTHDPRLASQIADNLVIVAHGRVIASGPMSDVVRSTDRDVVRVLTDVLSETATYAGDILDLMDPSIAEPGRRREQAPSREDDVDGLFLS